MSDSRRAKAAPATTAIKSVDVSTKPRGPAKPPAPRGSGNTRKMPTRSRKGPWTLVVVVAVVAGLVGAGIWLHSRQPSGPHAGDLRKYLVDVPDGATKATDLPGTDGKLDVAAMQKQSSDPSGVKAALDRYHFQGGAITGWTTDKSRVQIMILRYGSATDATSAVTQFAASEANSLGAPTPVNGMTNGAVFATPIDSPQVYVVGLGRNGDTVIVINAYPKDAGGLADAQKDVTFILTEQNAKLA